MYQWSISMESIYLRQAYIVRVLPIFVVGRFILHFELKNPKKATILPRSNRYFDFTPVMPPRKLKIIVVGPKNSGKTTISNFLMGQTAEITGGEYQPTIGCRILEAEYPSGGNQMVNVELWDASGDNRYDFDPLFLNAYLSC